MSRRPTRREIAEQDQSLLLRQQNFRHAADAVAAALAQFPEVRAIALFGSVARPLWREVPRFSDYRHHRIEVWHECKDVDLAVALDDFNGLRTLGRARNMAVTKLFQEKEIGVAHHEVDVFLFGRDWHDYRGRLCAFSQCPKGKRECLVPGCGHMAFLKQHENFEMHRDAVAPERSVVLFERGRGILRRAAELVTPPLAET
jgi:hypothetical protein